MEFARRILELPHCVPILPESRHWFVFERLHRDSEAKVNLVSGAFLAALATESGEEWVTLDGDFARLARLGWKGSQGMTQ